MDKDKQVPPEVSAAARALTGRRWEKATPEEAFETRSKAGKASVAVRRAKAKLRIALQEQEKRDSGS